MKKGEEIKYKNGIKEEGKQWISGGRQEKNMSTRYHRNVFKTD